MSDRDPDPKGLIRESYRIEGITEPDCRTIFLDWAIGIPSDVDPSDEIRTVLAIYASEAPDHPMTKVLNAGLAAPARSGRRGGRNARLKGPMG